MMQFFRKPVKKHLGVDIGTASLKVVELEDMGGRAKLSTYGSIDLPLDIIKSDSREVIVQISGALKELIKAAGVTADRATSALPGFSVFTTVIDLPKMPETELAQAIKYEAEKYIPSPIEDVVLDWENVGEQEAEIVLKGEKKKAMMSRILLTAASKNLVAKYMEIFKNVGLSLESLETEAVALVRALVGEDTSPLLLIDMGATATDICLVEDTSPRLTRSIDLGGNAVTRSIAKSLNIKPERAQQFKKDFGLKGITGVSLEEKVPQAIRAVIDDIVREIRHACNMFYNKGGRKIEKVILTGGAAKLSGLSQYLNSLLGVPVYLGNPWARVLYPEELKSILLDLGPDFSGAVGLAMRNIY
jgi:type IV pilus assembly protein PilM